MALLIALTVIAVGGVWYGVTRKKRGVTIASVIALVVIWVLAGIYTIIARQNPY